MNTKRMVIAIVIAAFSTGAGLADRFVATNGLNQSGYSNWVDAATNIQTAIDAASAEETVWVSNGVYTLTAEILLTKNINLRSLKGRDQTIVDGAQVVRCFKAQSAIGTVDGFTFQNGRTNGAPGGAGLYLNGVVMTITNCVIVSNKVSGGGGGGGIYGYCGTVTVAECEIRANTADAGYGGGMLLQQGLISNCRIVSNVGSNGGYAGGGYIGLNVPGPTSVIMTACVVTGNQCTGGAGGGGLYIKSTRLLNSLLAWNTAPQIGGISLGAGSYISNCVINSNLVTVSGGGVSFYSEASPGTVENCEIRGNSQTNSSDGYGAGVYMSKNGVIRDCLIAENVGAYFFAGIYSQTGTNLIQNCTIVSNYNSYFGGGVGLRATDRMENSICYSNKDNYTTPPDENRDNYYVYAAGAVITYCCTWPDPAAYGGGNITNSPQFAGFAAGNYRLSAGSPGVNAGSNQTWMVGAKELDGRQRIDQWRRQVDMGAYEFLYSGTMFTTK